MFRAQVGARAGWSNEYSLGTIRHGLLHAGQLPPRVAQRFHFARAPLLFLSCNQRSGSPLIREQKLAREPSVNQSDSQILTSWVDVRYWIRAWKGVSQAQSGRGGRKGRSPLLSCMPVDSATAHVRNGIASGAHARNAGAKGRGRPYGGTFMRRRRSWKRGPGRGDYFSLAYSALASFRIGMPGSASFQSVRKS